MPALLALLLAVALDAQSLTAVLEDKLIDRIRAIEAGTNGVVGAVAIDLTDGRTISYRGEAVFPQASSIKIPIMMQVFEQVQKGKLKVGDTLTLEPREAVAGSGHLRLTLREHPVSLTLLELITAMIETSDNTATNKLIATVGMKEVNAMLDRLGYRQTRLQRIMLDGAAAERNEENISTPLEMARIVELIYRGKAVDAESSKRMLEIMKLVNADFRSAVPASVVVASKPGAVTGVRCETGIIYVKNRPFALSVQSTFLTEGENAVAPIAKLFYEHFEKLGRSNRYGNGGVR